LRNTLTKVLGEEVAIVDSARTTAEVLSHELVERGLAAPSQQTGAVRFLATDGAERFARVGSLFLGQPFQADEVEIVDLNEREKS
jgi:glutamate racemase